MNLMLLQISAANTATNAPANTSSNPVTSTVAAVSDKLEYFKTKLIDLGTSYGMKVLVAIGILVVGFLVTRWVGKTVQNWLDKQQMEPPVKTLITRVVRLLIMVGFLVVALDQAGFPVTTVIAGIGVAGVGRGLAFAGVPRHPVPGAALFFPQPLP